MMKNLWKSYTIAFLLLCSFISSHVFASYYPTFKASTTRYTSIDSPIIIGEGVTKLKDHTYTIIADTADIEVIVRGDSVIEGGRNTHLSFIAHAGRTIRVKAEHDVTFRGKDIKDPILVTYGGMGTTIFDIIGGHTINFGSVDGNNPAKAFVLMDDPTYSEGHRPTLIFQRSCEYQEVKAATQDVVIAVNSNSVLSYLSQHKDICISEDQGAISFYPANVKPSPEIPSPGTMILKIHDGGFIVSGHYVEITDPTSGDYEPTDHHPLFTAPLYKQKFKSADIKLPILAGYKALARVKTVSHIGEQKMQGGLRIENYNSELSELLYDPFYHLGIRKDTRSYSGRFSGVRRGFIVGANGVLTIGDNTFVDYKACASNLEPYTIPSVSSYKYCSANVKSLFKKRNPSALVIDGSHNPDARPARIRLGKHAGLYFRSLANSHHDQGTADRVVDLVDMTPDEGEFVFIAESPLQIYGANSDKGEKSRIEILSLQVSSEGGNLFPCDHGDHKHQFLSRTFNRKPTSDGDYEQQGEYLRYNKAAVLINDEVGLHRVSLVHTDVNHEVIEKNDELSQPMYVGGEQWLLGRCALEDETEYDLRFLNEGISARFTQRPHISLFNARINIHTDIALTGLDIRIPNIVEEGEKGVENTSRLVFYQNGRRLDGGFGRNVLLGTRIGSLDYNIGINDVTPLLVASTKDAHIDVVQCQEGDYSGPDHALFLETGTNCSSVIERVKGRRTADKQPGVNTIFLGHNSNISVGSHCINRHDAGNFEKGTPAVLWINGDYFAISARGGRISDPKTAHVTGQGGVFVDRHGIFGITRNHRAVMETMVTRSSGGHVHLPAEQVIFGNLLGIADWKLDLSHEFNYIVVDQDEHISHYVLNWLSTKGDYESTSWYNQKNRPLLSPTSNKFDVPRLKEEHLRGIVTVQGTVDEFLVQGSRIGNEAQIAVNGGTIKELVFVPTDHGGEAPVGMVVLANEGTVGIGSTLAESESPFAPTTLGINGVTIVADGSGRAILNHDMVVSGRCAFVKGPHFVSGTDMLEITSDEPRTLRIQSTGYVDLQSFDDSRDIVRFSGSVRLIMEPGSSIIMGGGVLQIAQEAMIIMEPVHATHTMFNGYQRGKQVNTENPFVESDASRIHHAYAPLICAKGVKNTDRFRVKLHGTGTIQLVDEARMYIDNGAFVGIETLRPEHEADNIQKDAQENTPLIGITETALSVELRDRSRFSLGGNTMAQGGVLQVGNTENIPGHAVKFGLLINGADAKFIMGPRSFVGLGGGIVYRKITDTPNDWIVDVLWNVSDIRIEVRNGLFSHAQIYPGNDPWASLLMLGHNNVQDYQPTRFNFIFPKVPVAQSPANVHGGGNIAVIANSGHAVHPIVHDQDGIIDIHNNRDKQTIHQTMQVGILASRAMMHDIAILATDAFGLFKAIKMNETTSIPAAKSANLACAAIGEAESNGFGKKLRVAAIDRGIIDRGTVTAILDINGGSIDERMQRAAHFGAVGVAIDIDENAPARIRSVTQIS